MIQIGLFKMLMIMWAEEHTSRYLHSKQVESPCWFNVGPLSVTMDQNLTKIGSMSCVCCLMTDDFILYINGLHFLVTCIRNGTLRYGNQCVH